MQLLDQPAEGGLFFQVESDAAQNQAESRAAEQECGAVLLAAGWIDEAMYEPLDTMAEAAQKVVAAAR